MNIDSITVTLKKQLSRIGSLLFLHNRMIFFLLFIFGLIYAVLSLNLVLGKPSDEDYRSKKLSEARATRFDQTTIDQINTLNTKTQLDPGALPVNQRISPFSE